MFLSKIKDNKPLSKKLIAKKLNFWKKHLQLNPKWDISFVLHENSLELPEDCQNMEAYIDIELGYWDAEIHINGPLCNEKNIDNVLVHELLHILTEPLENFARMSSHEKYHELITQLNESMIENLIPGIMNKL
jgi:hypothetical protein